MMPLYSMNLPILLVWFLDGFGWAWVPPHRSVGECLLTPKLSPCNARSRRPLFLSANDTSAPQVQGKVLVLGGTGFVGRRVVDLLEQREIPFVATSTTDRSGAVSLDMTRDDASQTLLDLCERNGVSAIVSTVGSIFTDRDYETNSATGRVAAAAFASKDENSMPKCVFIGNSRRVRNVCNAIPSLNDYARGKEESERLIEDTFGRKAFLIRPTSFIHGGDEFKLNPPRVPKGIGEIIEALLGLYPVQALAEALPDVLGVALEAPVNVDAVALAIVNVATGLCHNTVMETREDIIMAASQRPAIGASMPSHMDKRRDELKQILSRHAKEHTPEENFEMLEELERLKPIPMRPTDDPLLNGRWDFCFDVEPDVGTGFIKDLFEGNGPAWARRIVDFRGVHMEIGDGQTRIQLVVSVAAFGRDLRLILHTSLSPAPRNPNGTMFMEKFEGIDVNGFRLPYPNAWKKSRYLEFSYLDDGFAIARGAGGEPHFLLRG
ncbi:hypothetical protein ACHAWF_001640 [Thalassiosira exigua]